MKTLVPIEDADLKTIAEEIDRRVEVLEQAKATYRLVVREGRVFAEVLLTPRVRGKIDWRYT